MNRVEKSIGVALGGGGARGLAHVAILETLDAMGVRVSALAGTSIGAIIGSGYAAGRSAADIRAVLDRILDVEPSSERWLTSKRLFRWLDLLDIEFGRSHILEAQAFISEMSAYVGVETFEELDIPLKVVAADFWSRREVVFDSGPLMQSVAASFSLPGIFRPVIIDDQVLIDGGCVNPVPFDLLRDQCDIVIGVDVQGRRDPGDDQLPTYSEALFNTFQIASSTIARMKMALKPCDIYIEPAICDVRMLDFHKADQIYEQTAPECERLEAELTALLAE